MLATYPSIQATSDLTRPLPHFQIKKLGRAGYNWSSTKRHCDVPRRGEARDTLVSVFLLFRILMLDCHDRISDLPIIEGLFKIHYIQTSIYVF